MTGDIRKQLIEALDRREAEALDGTSDIAPGWLLSLVGYFRELIADHAPKPLIGEISQCERCAHYTPCPDIERAAAFWLGTPEVDR